MKGKIFVPGLALGVLTSITSAIWLALSYKGQLDSGRFEVVQSVRLSSSKIAMLVRRSDDTALSGDTYFVIMRPQLLQGNDLREAFYSKPTIFVAGRSGLSIKGEGNTLMIVCTECGITPDLIEKQRFSDQGVSIRYSGFPTRNDDNM